MLYNLPELHTTIDGIIFFLTGPSFLAFVLAYTSTRYLRTFNHIQCRTRRQSCNMSFT